QFSTSRHHLYASVSICLPPANDHPLSAPASPLPLSFSGPPALQLLDNQNLQTVHLCYLDLQDQLASLVPSPPRPSSAADRSSPKFSAHFIPLLRRFSLSLPLHRRHRRRGVCPQDQPPQPQSHDELDHQFSPSLPDFLLTNHYGALIATFPFTFRS
ncbi:unnamed protein product, partial [Dibothriocephalus latus]